MQRLKGIFDTKLYTEVALGSIPHSCCSTCTIPAYDFDSIKDYFCTNILSLSNKLKSVDAVCFSPSGNLLLVEMKRYSRSGVVNMKEYVDGHLQEQELPHKIVDSLLLILSICGYYDIEKTFYSHILENKPTPKIKPFLLVNLSSRDYFKYLALCKPYSNISFTKRISSEIAILDCRTFAKQFPNM